MFSRSQGRHHVPWGAEIDGVEYKIHSPIPDIAFELIEEWLIGDKMKNLEDEVSGNQA